MQINAASEQSGESEDSNILRCSKRAMNAATYNSKL
jgi:hypothetical protein